MINLVFNDATFDGSVDRWLAGINSYRVNPES